jgi:DNA invertase Pin-like site-specific DNA recombinase
MGRRPLAPTAKQRRLVGLLKAAGWSNEAIARHLGITRPTLDKHFGQDLRDAKDRQLLWLLSLLWREARRGKVSAMRQLLRRMNRAHCP